MKFIFADSLDYVDPNYDFLKDESAPGRKPYWDDAYPHELMGKLPYDGILVSRAIVGDHAMSGKYTEAQAMRFRRIGARRFLRFDTPACHGLPIFGDCGAFSYADQTVPPYSPDDTIDFYEEAGFTHGFSVDHIIFDFNKEPAEGLGGGTSEAHRRFELTLELAEAFLARHQALKAGFEPIGVIQGWSPGSMADAARRLVKMGYRYVALGGMVPLKTDLIQLALRAVEKAIADSPEVKVHILGFAKADDLPGFTEYRIDSFDTTSPLIRAFKDARRNYYLVNANGQMEYYTAIRVPQVHGNNTLKREIQIGRRHQETLLRLEETALRALRAYAERELELGATLDALIHFLEPLVAGDRASAATIEKKLLTARQQYERTLEARPWERCDCAVCRNAGVETLMFRSSNRNKRRGIHNLYVFHNYLHRILNK